MNLIRVRPGNGLSGDLRTPSDKSISHRAFLLALLANGSSEISHPLEGLDVQATMNAVSQFGARIRKGDDLYEVRGPGLESLASPEEGIDCGNSGTLMRLLSGIAVAGNVTCTLSGDESLNRRPMGRVVDPLTRMGANIMTTDGTAPLRISPAIRLDGINYESPVASAQVKSLVLLAGLSASGKTSVTEPSLSRDHTERMLPLFGCEIARSGLTVTVEGGARLHSTHLSVPADISSAAFPLVAATIVPDSRVLLREVSVNPARAGILEILAMMGARITVQNRRELSGEPVADLEVCAAELKGIEIPPGHVASAIDEFPAILVAAALAQGTTTLRNASELRVKESDRIAAMAAGLESLGAETEEFEDGISVKGRPEGLTGGEVESFGDHRIAMALAVAGTRSRDGVTISNCDNVQTSYPGFIRQCRELGINASGTDDGL